MVRVVGGVPGQAVVRVSCTLALASCARSFMSAAAEVPSSLTCCAPSVAVSLTDYGLLCRFLQVLHLLTASVTSDLSGSTFSCSAAASFFSFSLAGMTRGGQQAGTEGIPTRQPGDCPGLVRDPMWGLLDCFACLASAPDGVRVLWTPALAESAVSSAAPMTLVLTLFTVLRTFRPWRWAMLEGLTLSARASTFVPSPARVRSISARISSGVCVMGLPHLV